MDDLIGMAVKKDFVAGCWRPPPGNARMIASSRVSIPTRIQRWLAGGAHGIARGIHSAREQNEQWQEG
jgi:hypothetical protein